MGCRLRRMGAAVVLGALAVAAVGAAPAEARPGSDRPSGTVRSTPARSATVPPAPGFTASSGINGGAVLGWQSSGNGGSSLTGYVLTPFHDGTALAPLAVGSAEAHVTIVLTSLGNGSIWTFKVAAKNAVGTGPQSSLSAKILPPFAQLVSFVDQQYRDLVGRPANAAEQSAGAAQIDGGGTPGSIVLQLRRSREDRGHVDPVARLYFAFFLRVPDAGGMQYWIGRVRNGTTLVTIADRFAQSSEFVNRYGALDNRHFVALVYQNVLGRAPDQAGSDYWTGQLDTHARTRGDVMAGFSESPEHITRRAPAVDVAVTWIDLLAVAPSKADFDYWVNKLTVGGDTAADLAGVLFATPTYAGRFSA